jgi:membrane protein YqaA with SNARE-associated domain
MSLKQRYIIGSLFILLSVAGSFAFLYYWNEIKDFGGYGYPFVFFISLVAGSSLPIPAPYIVAVFAMAAVLNPFLVGVVAGLGAATGGLLVYLFGRGGSRILPWNSSPRPGDESAIARWTQRITRWAHSRGSLIVFLMSVIFNPAFGPIAITMGAIRFQMTRFFLLCWAGNTIKSLIIAYCGYFGMGALLRWLGVSL